MRKAILLSIISAVCALAESNFHAMPRWWLCGMRRRQATPSGVWRRGQLHSQGRNRERYLELGLYGAGGLVQTRSALLLVDPNGRITRSIKAPEGHTLLAPGTA